MNTIATTTTATMILQAPSTLRSLLRLCKPRVIALIVFTAMIGMVLGGGTPGSGTLNAELFLAASIGIALVAGAAAAINCLVEHKIDAIMARTRARPLPLGQVSTAQALVFALVIGAAGLAILHEWVNTLTMWLTLATFVGYALLYTILLKPSNPQNIVIGGATGAMPPLLGWAAVTGGVTREALILFLIIFCWTPPHFWALALYRAEEYARAGLPMLPVTHGQRFTTLHILLYTVTLAGVSLLPFSSGMSGWLYLVGVIALNIEFLRQAVALHRQYDDARARRMFRYSIVYLSLLFLLLLLDRGLTQLLA